MTGSVSKGFAQHGKTSQQVKLLEKEKNSRTAAQKKIDSRLLQAVREWHGGKMTPGTHLEPSNVNADAHGNLQVDISAEEVSDALLNSIKRSGGKIIYSSKQYHTIRAGINLSMVETIAGYKEVKFIEPAQLAVNNKAVNPNIIKITVDSARGRDK